MTVTTYKLCQLCGDVHSIHVDVDANTAVCFDSLCNTCHIHMKIHLEGPLQACDQGEIHFVPVSPKRLELCLVPQNERWI